ncbi:MAG: hypothetical protein K2X93_04675 [Candidatus Obscuribacterales bacterium]|nr:hypothetical protein [Candidatus Obscuribacterales bacterium]
MNVIPLPVVRSNGCADAVTRQSGHGQRHGAGENAALRSPSHMRRPVGDLGDVFVPSQSIADKVVGRQHFPEITIGGALSIESWICPACTLRQPKAGLCIFCGAPTPDATLDESSYLASLEDAVAVGSSDGLKLRRQFITSRIRSDFPSLKEDSFNVETIRNARKKLRWFVYGESSHGHLDPYEKSVLLQDCLDELFGFGPLGPIMRDPEICEVHVHSKELTRARKRGGALEPIVVRFDDEDHLKRIVEAVRERSTPRAWVYPGSEEQEQYISADGVKVAVAHESASPEQPFIRFLFPEPLGTPGDSGEARESSVKPLENHPAIRQRRQFICEKIRKEYPRSTCDEFERMRKKIRQLVFSDSSGARLTSYEKTVLFQECLDEVFGYGPFSALLRDPDIGEIRVYSPGRTTISRRGQFETMHSIFDNEAHLKRQVNLIVAQAHPRSSENSLVDELIMPSGYRVAVRRAGLHADEPFIVIKHLERD